MFKLIAHKAFNYANDEVATCQSIMMHQKSSEEPGCWRAPIKPCAVLNKLIGELPSVIRVDFSPNDCRSFTYNVTTRNQPLTHFPSIKLKFLHQIIFKPLFPHSQQHTEIRTRFITCRFWQKQSTFPLSLVKIKTKAMVSEKQDKIIKITRSWWGEKKN